MDGPSAYPSEGEAVFADYLKRRGFRFEYEPVIGTRRPDFVAHSSSGDIAFDIYEPVLRVPNSVSSFDSVEPLYGAFAQRKRKQARAARTTGLPFVVVVGSANSDIPYDWFAAVGALRGRPGVSFPVGPGAPTDPEMTPALIGIGNTGGGDNTSCSALALVQTFNPTLWRLQLAQRERVRNHNAALPDNHDSRIRAVVEIAERYREIEDDLAQRRLYLPTAKRVRLSIYHNPNAAIPLPRTFAGLHDEQWDEVASPSGQIDYCQVSLGCDAQKWLPLED